MKKHYEYLCHLGNHKLVPSYKHYSQLITPMGRMDSTSLKRVAPQHRWYKTPLDKVFLNISSQSNQQTNNPHTGAPSKSKSFVLERTLLKTAKKMSHRTAGSSCKSYI